MGGKRHKVFAGDLAFCGLFLLLVVALLWLSPPHGSSPAPSSPPIVYRSGH
jgi:hypothetical protein